MVEFPLRNFFLIVAFFISHIGISATAKGCTSCISGKIKLDNTWNKEVYLSYIPTYEKMYQMSNEMIIAKATIDSTGYFQFNTSFLPKENNVFRIHITKKGDAPTSIIIGGKDENYLFFIANRASNIKIENTSVHPPFKHVVFTNSGQNQIFQKITNLVFINDSIASQSGLAKRQFVERKTNEELMAIADSSSNPLISLYALYKSDLIATPTLHTKFLEEYLKKWKKQDNLYFKAFKKQMPVSTTNNRGAFITVLFAIVFVTFGFLIGRFAKFERKKKLGIEHLSVQERKIFQLLQEGASNQDISDKHNIGISTVKSHVSSILAKLNMKSRKEIMNIK
ncbi:response regulator transcription factor [Zhouia sp. PK063]|uniref:response regulator transcription factor n=1 Tax=Zhouia sp. PK063 TaxID=3373602 RepID=UPI0037A5BDB9